MIHTMKLIKQFYVSPEHLEKCSCEVLTRDHRYREETKAYLADCSRTNSMEQLN